MAVGALQNGGGSVSQAPIQTQSYWERFDIIDDLDDYSDEEYLDDSDDDDLDLKQLQESANKAGGNYDDDENNEDMINDEIEDIDSDDDNSEIYEQYQRQQDQIMRQNNAGKVPGLSLTGIKEGGNYGQGQTGNYEEEPTKSIPKNFAI